jgi:hypothetical protein
MTVEDIKRLNYIKYSSFRDFVKYSHCLGRSLLSYLIRVPWHLLHWRSGNLETKEILFVVPSINNQKSVRTILEHLPEEKCSVWGSEINQRLPRTQIEILSLRYLPLFLKLYYSSSKEDKKLIRDFFCDFISTCATYRVLENVLIKNPQLKMVIMANDHVLITRCLVELTEKYHIKSLYVQHASVTEKFPPLRFDYSFLDGQESLEKYQKIGNMRGKAFLSGSPRFDDFFHIENEKKYDVGVALNALDSVEKALELCLYLKENYSDKIIVRPHAAMVNGMFDEELFLKHEIAVSNPIKDLSYVFISDIKVMIANESSIHLDAALMGVPSILYNFSDKEVVDWYSYLKNGLIKKCDSYDDVLERLASQPILPTEIVRYYAASYNTPINGKVGEMIANFIKRTLFVSPSEGKNYIESMMVWKEDHYEYRLYS